MSSSRYPILLLPIKIESRFIGTELRLRVIPDELFLDNFSSALTFEENTKGIKYLTADSKEAKQFAWKNLVDAYGSYRSTWIIKTASKEREDLVEELEVDPFFKLLPTRFHFYLYRNGKLYGSYSGEEINANGLTAFPGDKSWIEDFDVAVKAGMAIAIKLKDPENDTHFDKIIVTGIRGEDLLKNKEEVKKKNLALDSASQLSILLEHHQYTEGFSFIQFGTPTNNLGNTKSGHSSEDEYDVDSQADPLWESNNDSGLKQVTLDPNHDHYEKLHELSTKWKEFGKPEDLPISFAEQFSNALGLRTKLFQGVIHANSHTPSINYLIQKVSWFALGGYTLRLLFGNEVSNADREQLWRHYCRFVRARGPLPSVKIGEQPYGILPIQKLRGRTNKNEGSFSKRLEEVLLKLFEEWSLQATSEDLDRDSLRQVPRIDGAKDIDEEILSILSMQPFPTRFQFRAFDVDTLGSLENLLIDLNIPQKNYRPSLTLVYELLKENGRLPEDQVLQVEKNFQLIRKIAATIEGYDKDVLYYSPLLALLENGERSVEDLDIALAEEEEWYLSPIFLNYLEDVFNENHGLIWYSDKKFILNDLLLKGFSEAYKLFDRSIYFSPSKNDLIGFSYFGIGELVKKNGAILEEGEIVMTIIANRSGKPTDREHVINITAPFRGVLQYNDAVTKEGNIEGELFTITDLDSLNTLTKEIAFTITQFIIESTAISDSKKRLKIHETALAEVIDINSQRLDAWITSMASRRLQEIRSLSENAEGIYIGAYGWIENLEKNRNPVGVDKVDINDADGGIIHTPTIAQTVASAIFKDGYLNHQFKSGNDSNPFALNLTSNRIQKSKELLEGLRQGQQLEALLGYRLERFLHEEEMDIEIYKLRRLFPLDVEKTLVNGKEREIIKDLNVIDGLKAIKAKNNFSGKILQGINMLEDILDGSLDVLIYESGYQLTQGNFDQAIAAMEASKGKSIPPKIESLKTRIPGNIITHKFALLFPQPSKYNPLQVKAFVEPALEGWLVSNIGSMEEIGCTVQVYEEKNKELLKSFKVKLSDLDLNYLDILYLSMDPVEDGTSELESWIWHSIIQKENDLSEGFTYKITDQTPPNCQPLSHALEVFRYSFKLLTKARYLRSEDLRSTDETVAHDWDTLHSVKEDRIEAILEIITKDWSIALDSIEVIRALAKLNLPEAKRILVPNADLDREKLQREINELIKKVEAHLNQYKQEEVFEKAFEQLQKAAKIIFGDAFLLIPPAKFSDSFIGILKQEKQHLLVGSEDWEGDHLWGQERIQSWMQGLAHVRPNFLAFEEWEMLNNTWQMSQSTLFSPNSYQILQTPTKTTYPWVALSKREIQQIIYKNEAFQEEEVYRSPETGEPYPLEDGEYYPENCECLVVYAADDFHLSGNLNNETQYGLLIDTFLEKIPQEQVTTGVGFHYNAPNNEAPQAMLLGVPDDDQERWTADVLRELLEDTLDLAKVRMVDADAMKEFGFTLPMTFFTSNSLPRR